MAPGPMHPAVPQVGRTGDRALVVRGVRGRGTAAVGGHVVIVGWAALFVKAGVALQASTLLAAASSSA